MSRFKKFIWIIGIVLISIIAVFASKSWIGKTKRIAESKKVDWETVKVRKGTLKQTLTGTGAVEPAIREDIASKVTGKLKEVNVEIGDIVKKGDVLLELDDLDARLNYESLVNNLKQKELSLKKQENNVESLSIIAPFSGVITDIYVENGDTLAKNSKVVSLVDQHVLEVVLPFSGERISEVKTGMSAKVFIQDLMQSVSGIVTYVSKKPYYSETGGERYNVKIEINNPGIISDRMTAGAQIESSKGVLTSLETNKLKYKRKAVLSCDAGGDVVSVNVVKNDVVEKGQLLVQIENEEAIITRDSLKFQLKEAQFKVDLAKEDLDSYVIKSPIDGIVVNIKNMQKGDSVKSGVVLMTLVNTKRMQFDISVDELDISKVKLGQKVNVTLDALEDTLETPILGEVTQIAIESSSHNGVTTYPVTITIPGRENLRGGMNADAEILIQEKKNVLYVPIEAVIKKEGKSFVWIKADANLLKQEEKFSNKEKDSPLFSEKRAELKERLSKMDDEERREFIKKFKEIRKKRKENLPDSSKNLTSGAKRGYTAAGYYDGAVMIPVQTGIYNESYIEILSGLKEGDEVILPEPTKSGNEVKDLKNGSKAFPLGRMIKR